MTKDMKNTISVDMEKRYCAPIIKFFLLEACAIDPRFCSFAFLEDDECDEVYESLGQNVATFISAKNHSEIKEQNEPEESGTINEMCESLTRGRQI